MLHATRVRCRGLRPLRSWAPPLKVPETYHNRPERQPTASHQRPGAPYPPLEPAALDQLSVREPEAVFHPAGGPNAKGVAVVPHVRVPRPPEIPDGAGP